MADQPNASGAAITYTLGAAGAVTANLTLNDWLLIFSLVLVLIRIPIDLKRLYDTFIKPGRRRNGQDPHS